MSRSYSTLMPFEKQLVKALAFAFTQRGAAMRELFAGERADLITELYIAAHKYEPDTDLGLLIALALRMDALPVMRAAVQVIEGGNQPANIHPITSQPLSQTRQAILDVLVQGPMTPAMIAVRLGTPKGTMRGHLKRMLAAGQVEKHGDHYAVPTQK